MTAEYRDGDTVEVTLKGKVVRRLWSAPDPDFLDFALSKGCGYTVPLEHPDVSVAVLEKGRPKVGEVLSGRELDEADMPIGTHVQFNVTKGNFRTRTSEGWVSSSVWAVQSNTLQQTEKYKILYVPE